MPATFGSCPAWRYGIRLISDDICQTTQEPTIYESQVGCCGDEPKNTEELIDHSLLISFCFSIGLIIIASLVGFSFTKRPCSYENITSVTTGASANHVTPSVITRNKKASIEPTDIGITVND